MIAVASSAVDRSNVPHRAVVRHSRDPALDRICRPSDASTPALQNSEALIDLFVEQTFGVYLGLGIKLAFRVGVEAGLPAEAMVLELYQSGEMAKTIEAFGTDGCIAGRDSEGVDRSCRDPDQLPPAPPYVAQRST